MTLSFPSSRLSPLPTGLLPTRRQAVPTDDAAGRRQWVENKWFVDKFNRFR